MKTSEFFSLPALLTHHACRVRRTWLPLTSGVFPPLLALGPTFTRWFPPSPTAPAPNSQSPATQTPHAKIDFSSSPTRPSAADQPSPTARSPPAVRYLFLFCLHGSAFSPIFSLWTRGAGFSHRSIGLAPRCRSLPPPPEWLTPHPSGSHVTDPPCQRVRDSSHSPSLGVSFQRHFSRGCPHHGADTFPLFATLITVSARPHLCKMSR